MNPILFWILFSIAYWALAFLLIKKKIKFNLVFPSAKEMFQLSKEIKAMPVGVVLISTNKVELTLLPGGYVTVRRMNYGEELDRTGLATKFKMGSTKTENAKDSFAGELDINTKEIALWDFANLIVDHNITDENERLLNFKNPADVARLHPLVGKEIGEAIDAWQSQALETSDEVKNS